MKRYAIQHWATRPSYVHVFPGVVEREAWLHEYADEWRSRGRQYRAWPDSSAEALRVVRETRQAKSGYFSVVVLHNGLRKADLPLALQRAGEWFNLEGVGRGKDRD